MVSEFGEAWDDLTSDIIGAAIEVHRHLGAGFMESVYQRALAIEMAARGLSFAREAPVRLVYKGQDVGEARLDFLVQEQVIVELKAVDALHPIHHAQVINYLRATHLPLGLLINFNVTALKDGIERIVLTT